MQLDQKQFADKVRACWIGKNIGGTMGGPYEHHRKILDVKGFSTPPNVVLPNDDLDLQLIWLYAMERFGFQNINANLLAELWTSCTTPYWNEYGIGKANLRRGLRPPLSGDYENDWCHSNGAWIRTEIWACAAPGVPEIAAKYAMEDAAVDHGAGEGTFAAIFVAALQSAAFVVPKLRQCIDIGLAAIPADSRTARSIQLVMEMYDRGQPWQDSRNAVLEQNSDIGDGWFEAPSNVAYAVLGLLYGEGDFKKSMLTAINCGDDTDCTAATVGATLGILGGMAVIPQDWMEYIGDEIVTISINMAGALRGGWIPATCTQLTERVVELAPHALFSSNKRPNVEDVTLGEGNSIPDDIQERMKANVRNGILSKASQLKPYTMHFESGFLQAQLTLEEAPEIAPQGQCKVQILFKNNSGFENMQHPLSLRWLLPEGFTASGKSNALLYGYDKHGRGTAEVDVIIRAGDTVAPQNRIVLEVTAPGRHTALYASFLLFGC